MTDLNAYLAAAKAEQARKNKPVIGKCGKCGPVRMTVGDVEPHGWSVQCPGCNRWLSFMPVSGKAGKRKCGSWCTEGTGRNCTCECEGANHASAYSAATLGALWAEK